MSALYNYSEFVHLNRERRQSLAMGAQERGDAAVVTRAGKTQARGSGSHLQWVGTQERGEVAAVIRSGWARGERRGREEQGMAVDGGEEGRHETK